MGLLASKQSACLLEVLNSWTSLGTENARLMRQQLKVKIIGSSSKLSISWLHLKSRKSTVDNHKALAEHVVLAGCSELTGLKSSDCVVPSNDSV